MSYAEDFVTEWKKQKKYEREAKDTAAEKLPDENPASPKRLKTDHTEVPAETAVVPSSRPVVLSAEDVPVVHLGQYKGAVVLASDEVGLVTAYYTCEPPSKHMMDMLTLVRMTNDAQRYDTLFIHAITCHRTSFSVLGIDMPVFDENTTMSAEKKKEIESLIADFALLKAGLMHVTRAVKCSGVPYTHEELVEMLTSVNEDGMKWKETTSKPAINELVARDKMLVLIVNSFY